MAQSLLQQSALALEGLQQLARSGVLQLGMHKDVTLSDFKSTLNQSVANLPPQHTANAEAVTRAITGKAQEVLISMEQQGRHSANGRDVLELLQVPIEFMAEAADGLEKRLRGSLEQSNDLAATVRASTLCEPYSHLLTISLYFSL
jgi:hypothetical protein